MKYNQHNKKKLAAFYKKYNFSPIPMVIEYSDVILLSKYTLNVKKRPRAKSAKFNTHFFVKNVYHKEISRF